MAKKKQRKSESKARREPPRVHASKRDYHTPEELLSLILEIWKRGVPLAGDDLTPARRLAIITAGIVTGAKLLIRLTSRDGSLEMSLKPTVEYTTEKASDELAETLRQQLLDTGIVTPEMLQLLPSVFFGEDNPKEPTIKYVQVVRERTNWRWVHPAFDPRVDSGKEVVEFLVPFRWAFAIAHEVVEVLWQRRALVKDPKLEMISEYIASIAAAKWCLSLWGNHKQAAALEHFSELGSETLYSQIQKQVAERAAARL